MKKRWHSLGARPTTTFAWPSGARAHRMESLRRKHLTIALLKDPDHATARGSHGAGELSRPVAITGSSQRASEDGFERGADSCRVRRQAEAVPDNSAAPTGSWRVGASITGSMQNRPRTAAVTQLEPGRDAAWKRLGYRRQGGRWLTEGQIAADKAEAEAQRKADKQWMSRLTRWRSDLEDVNAQAAATRSLDGVVDPRAVRSVWAVFGTGTAPLQKIAVQVLGQIDSTASTCGLPLSAIGGDSGEVRSIATQTLRGAISERLRRSWWPCCVIRGSIPTRSSITIW